MGEWPSLEAETSGAPDFKSETIDEPSFDVEIGERTSLALGVLPPGAS